MQGSLGQAFLRLHLPFSALLFDFFLCHNLDQTKKLFADVIKIDQEEAQSLDPSSSQLDIELRLRGLPHCLPGWDGRHRKPGTVGWIKGKVVDIQQNGIYL